MNNEEKILNVLEVIQGSIKVIQNDISDIKEDIAILKEDSEEFRSNLNTLIEWSDDVGKLMQVDLVKRD